MSWIVTWMLLVKCKWSSPRTKNVNSPKFPWSKCSNIHSFRWMDRMKEARTNNYISWYSTLHILWFFQDSFKNFHSKQCGTFPAEAWVCHPHSGNHPAPCLSSEAVFCYLIDLKIRSVTRTPRPHPPNEIQFFWRGKCRWSRLPCPCNRK